MAAAVVPGWAYLEGAGLNLAGWITETEVGGQRFLELHLTPDGPCKRLINAHGIKAISPLSEQTARDIIARQWSTAVTP